VASIGGVLSKVAPWIAAAASAPLPGFVGMAAQTLSGLLGKTVAPNAQAITEAARNASTEQLQAIRAADQDFALKMQTLGFQSIEQVLRADDDDRANARAREIALKDRLPAILALAVSAAFFGLLWILARWNIPKENSSILYATVGTLGTAFISIIGYYFGSSAGSDAKTKIIGDIAKS
jgi:hypothetical protein